ARPAGGKGRSYGRKPWGAGAARVSAMIAAVPQFLWGSACLLLHPGVVPGWTAILVRVLDGEALVVQFDELHPRGLADLVRDLRSFARQNQRGRQRAPPHLPSALAIV